MGPSTYDVRFLQGFLTYLPTHVQFCPNIDFQFYYMVSDFGKSTYLPKNRTSFMDVPLSLQKPNEHRVLSDVVILN